MVYCIEKPKFEDNSLKTRIKNQPPFDNLWNFSNNFKKCSLCGAHGKFFWIDLFELGRGFIYLGRLSVSKKRLENG